MTDESADAGAIVGGSDSVRWPDPKRGPWRVACRWTNVNGYARLTALEVEGIETVTKSGAVTIPTLTASVLRELPLDHVANLVLEKVRATFEGHYVGPGKAPDIMGHHIPGGKTGRRPLTTESLVQVAAIYRAGGTKPTKAVAEALNISRSAAAKRVVRAREVGLLEPTTQGRAGGPEAKKARRR